MYLNLDEIEEIQIDHTSRCNLACPQCARTDPTGGRNSNLDLVDLSVEQYKLIFTPFIGKQIRIFHCGNYGDALASPTFDETFNWCLDNGFTTNTIVTNGSLRNTEWWANFGKLGAKVVFSVDGLEDTNNIYRVNSNFAKIISNIEAFCNAGGRARWDFILFNHNKHQVEDAKALATRLGVEEFNVKITTRFAKESKYTTKIGSKTTVIDDNNNTTKKVFDTIIKDFGDFKKYADTTVISCKYKKSKTIFIDFDTRVWPCCWMGAPSRFLTTDLQKSGIVKLFNEFGDDFNRLDIHGWSGVLSHPWFLHKLEESWADSNSRLYTCGRTCGQIFEFSSGYGSNRHIYKLK